MAVTLSSSVLDRYRRFSRFNSPYPAHDDGCAIDLYPDSEAGISPVAGVVRETRTVGCPDRPYAADEDHLIVVESSMRTGADEPARHPERSRGFSTLFRRSRRVTASRSATLSAR